MTPFSIPVKKELTPSKVTEPMKVDAYNESKKKGYQKAIEVSQEDSEEIFEEMKSALL